MTNQGGGAEEADTAHHHYYADVMGVCRVLPDQNHLNHLPTTSEPFSHRYRPALNNWSGLVGSTDSMRRELHEQSILQRREMNYSETELIKLSEADKTNRRRRRSTSSFLISKSNTPKMIPLQ